MDRFTETVRVTYHCAHCNSRRDLARKNPDAQANSRVLDCINCDRLQQFYRTEVI